MFERFTRKARLAVVGAQEQAHERKATTIRTEHLLMALFTVPDSLAVAVMERFDVTRDRVMVEIDRMGGPTAAPSDAAALATLGIDLDEVRRHVEQSFGPGALDRTRAALGRRRAGRAGHLPFDRSTKRTLELALHEATLLGHTSIGTEHILLGLLHHEGGAAHHVLATLGLTLDPARTLVDALARGRKAG